jgi:sorbitol-specific phosphotransferase system component IIC
MTLGAHWMKALGKTKDEIQGNKSPLPFVIAAAAQLVIAYMLAGVMGHLGAGTVTVWHGVVTGLFLWFGFVVTTMAVNYAFQGARPMLTLIDGGHWLGVLVLQGLIIGWIGV